MGRSCISLHGVAVGAVLALAVHVVLDAVVELALAVPDAALVLADPGSDGNCAKSILNAFALFGAPIIATMRATGRTTSR